MFMKMVVLTRKQLKKTKQGRTNRWVINSNLNSWRACKSNFKIWWILWKIYLVESELEVSKNCTKPLSKQTEKLQRNTLVSPQYPPREMIEINPVLENIQDTQLEESICQALSLTVALVSLGDLDNCHRVRQKDWMIVKFSSRKKKK